MSIVDQNFSAAVWKALQKVEETEELIILIPLDNKPDDEPVIIQTNKIS